MNWLLENWQMIMAVAGAVLVAARAVVALTPTQVDNKIVDFLVKIVELLSGFRRDAEGIKGTPVALTTKKEVEEDSSPLSKLDNKK